MSSKDTELPQNAISDKLDSYIYSHLTFWRYTSEYVICGLPKMQNYLSKVGLERKVYNKQASQTDRSKRFLFAFVSI